MKYYRSKGLWQGWPNCDPRAASRPLANLIQSAKRLAHLFKHHVSECGQQCNARLVAAWRFWLCTVSTPPGNREFDPRVKTFGHPWII